MVIETCYQGSSADTPQLPVARTSGRAGFPPPGLLPIYPRSGQTLDRPPPAQSPAVGISAK